MDYTTDNLKKLIERIKTIRLFDRIFYWGNVKYLMIDAVSDLQKIMSNAEYLNTAILKLEAVNSGLTKDIELSSHMIVRQTYDLENYKTTQKENSDILQNVRSLLSVKEVTIENLKQQLSQLETTFALLSQKTEILFQERENLKQQNNQFLSEEINRKQKFENDIATLNSIRNQIQNDRNLEIEERNTLEIERLKNLKETWNKHQTNANNIIRGICNKHVIEYVERVPFNGEPDNTLKICDEFVIFDAKSPANDDLTNFPGYLKDQAERAKKYARQDNVKSDIFFVVPANTLFKLSQFVFNLADYNVFVISVDSLEQIILSLKKIEEYEFAEQLSPEERDNICRVIGKYAHLTKRRIQIDSFFAKQFIELAYKTETDLPKDIFDKVIDFEKSEKLNPPVEKRAKAINIKELEKDALKLKNEVVSKGIEIDDSKISVGINDLQLYRDEPLD